MGKENELPDDFSELYSKASFIIENSRNVVGTAVNMLTIYTNFQIGKYIVEQEQQGQDRAKYGAKVLDSLAVYLTDKYGRGFSRTNIASMRKFYMIYKERENQIMQSQIAQLPNYQKSGIVQSQIAQFEIKQDWPFLLSWTHYQVLMRIENDDERMFYEKEASQSHWNVQTLKMLC